MQKSIQNIGKFIFSLFIATQFFTINILATSNMPPMPPFMMQDAVKNNAPATKNNSKVNTKNTDPKKKNFKSKVDSIPECGSLPPMIIFLPPPMEKDLIACRNKFFKPKLDVASKALSEYYKKSIKVTKIEVISEFREVYRVHITEKKKKYTKYCNSSMTSCLK